MTERTFAPCAPFAARLDPKSLSAALKLFDKIVERRNHIPILGCVHLAASEDMVTLSCTDLDIFASVQLPADCLAARPVAIELAALKAASSKAKGETIALADIGGAVTFRDETTGVCVRLPMREATDFPMLPPAMLEPRDTFALGARQLRDDLARTRAAASSEVTRYYLNGVFWHKSRDEYGHDVLRMAATDGHRLARVTRPFPASVDDFPESILPNKTCNVLMALMAKAGEADECRVGFSPKATGGAAFSFGRWRIVSKLIDGHFPDYSRVIPCEGQHSMSIGAKALRDIAANVTGHVSAKEPWLQLSWNARANWMTAYSRCPDNGPAMMPVEGGEFTDDVGETGDFGICMNSKYLRDLLAQWGDARVTFHCRDAGSPMLLTSDEAPEYVQVLMPMRSEWGIITPHDIEKLNRDPVATFVAEAPGALEDLAAVETADLSAAARRNMRKGGRKVLAALVQGAIAHKVAGGQDRGAARGAILLKLAQMRGDDRTFDRLAAILTHKATSSYAAWDAAVRGVAVLQPQGKPVQGDAGGDDAVPVEPANPAPMPQPGEAAPAPEPEPVAVEVIPALPGEKPLFRSLQDFKAMAGVGSRWTLRNWDHRTGAWGEARMRTVATVRARDIGFVDGDATPIEIAAANERGFGGRSWIGFPKSGGWTSTPGALITLYGDGSPCMMIEPAPAAIGDASDEPAGHSDELAALLDMVAALGERLARLESPSQDVSEADALPDVEEPETPPAPALAENSGSLDGYVPLADFEAMKARAEAAEAKVEEARRLMALELAGRDRSLARARRRIMRLTAVLAGRKRQLAQVGKDLLFARTKAAQLQRDRDHAKAQPRAVPVERASVTYTIGKKAG